MINGSREKRQKQPFGSRLATQICGKAVEKQKEGEDL
jgi:hypothetical protein